jgi:sodium/potassium/calcium exchanger 6
VAALALLFRLMARTADGFLSATLSQLSQDLGLPPRLAGVTLLALGNGAPDLSSCIAAVKSGNYRRAPGGCPRGGPAGLPWGLRGCPGEPPSGLPTTRTRAHTHTRARARTHTHTLPACRLALGALTGASMFVACVVAGRIVSLGGGAKARGAQLRDVLCLGIAVAVVTGIGQQLALGGGLPVSTCIP